MAKKKIPAKHLAESYIIYIVGMHALYMVIPQIDQGVLALRPISYHSPCHHPRRHTWNIQLCKLLQCLTYTSPTSPTSLSIFWSV